MAKKVLRQGKIIEVDPENDWKQEWLNMPEFENQDCSPVKSIKVSFASEEDIQKFAELIGQTVTMKTRTVWYPKAKKLVDVREVYYDKPEDDIPF